MLDEAVRLGLHRGHHFDEMPAAIERELGLDRLDGERAATFAASLQGRRGRPGARQRPSPWLRCGLFTGEDPVDAVVVQALVGANDRTVKRGLNRLGAA